MLRLCAIPFTTPSSTEAAAFWLSFAAFVALGPVVSWLLMRSATPAHRSRLATKRPVWRRFEPFAYPAEADFHFGRFFRLFGLWLGRTFLIACTNLGRWLFFHYVSAPAVRFFWTPPPPEQP